jgi:hypothetical protein
MLCRCNHIEIIRIGPCLGIHCMYQNVYLFHSIYDSFIPSSLVLAPPARKLLRDGFVKSPGGKPRQSCTPESGATLASHTQLCASNNAPLRPVCLLRNPTSSTSPPSFHRMTTNVEGRPSVDWKDNSGRPSGTCRAKIFSHE